MRTPQAHVWPSCSDGNSPRQILVNPISPFTLALVNHGYLTGEQVAKAKKINGHATADRFWENLALIESGENLPMAKMIAEAIIETVALRIAHDLKKNPPKIKTPLVIHALEAIEQKFAKDQEQNLQ